MSPEFAGVLRERVTLMRRDPARDALGGASGTWSEVRDFWAAVEPVGAREMPRWRVMLRDEGGSPVMGDRLGWGGRTLAILAIGSDPRLPGRITIEAEETR